MSTEGRQDPRIAKVIDAGIALGIEVQPVRFGTEIRTAQDAAREIGCELAQIVKSLVFQAGDHPLLFLVSGSNRLDVGKGARAASVDHLEKADAAVTKETTGFSIGGIPPFGHDIEVPVYMDEDLLRHDIVWAACGMPDSVFPVGSSVLAGATKATIADLKQD